jgi:predicted nucleic acid-binding protein
MVAVDSNILVYLLLNVEHTARARALLEADADWHSDEFVLVELTNVLATAIRVRGLPLPQAAAALAKAVSVIESGLHMARHADVLALAAQLQVSAYDARFLVVARDLGVRLVTEDAKLRRAAPTLTQSLAEALAGADR